MCESQKGGVLPPSQLANYIGATVEVFWNGYGTEHRTTGTLVELNHPGGGHSPRVKIGTTYRTVDHLAGTPYAEDSDPWEQWVLLYLAPITGFRVIRGADNG
jgi:hypothetical protein